MRFVVNVRVAWKPVRPGRSPEGHGIPAFNATHYWMPASVTVGKKVSMLNLITGITAEFVRQFVLTGSGIINGRRLEHVNLIQATIFTNNEVALNERLSKGVGHRRHHRQDLF